MCYEKLVCLPVRNVMHQQYTLSSNVDSIHPCIIQAESQHQKFMQMGKEYVVLGLSVLCSEVQHKDH